MKDKECREVLYKLVELLDKYDVFVEDGDSKINSDYKFRHEIQDIVREWRKGGYHF